MDDNQIEDSPRAPIQAVSGRRLNPPFVEETEVFEAGCVDEVARLQADLQVLPSQESDRVGNEGWSVG